MLNRRRALWLVAICLMCMSAPPRSGASRLSAAGGPVSVLTNRYDNGRTGATLAETVLTPGNVAPGSFGLLYSIGPVDGTLYAQPLYVPHLATTVGTFNVVILATAHNTIYAFDADGSVADPLWTVNLGPSVIQDPDGDPAGTLVPDCLNLTPEIGITSTPVIDADAGVVYALAKTRDADGVVRQRLHAVALASGASLGSTEIGASVTTGDTTISFRPEANLNRPGLLLSNGTIYAAFGSLCDYGEYNGWVMAYDAASLTQTAAWTVTPDGYAGAIWQSGTGLSTDADGNVYTLTGNGTFTEDGLNLSNSFVKLSAAPSLRPLDYFTPNNQAELSDNDWDLGSTGVMVIPGTNLLLGAGKEGRMYLIDATNMGRFDPGNDAVVQSFQVTDEAFQRNIHGSPVWWWGPAGGRMYVWGEAEELKSYAFDGVGFDPTPVGRGPVAAPGEGAMPGGIVTLSANGSQAGTGIVWATVPRLLDAQNQIVPGVLHAFDAEDVSRELWNSDLDPGDELGMFAKFTPPIVVNGKVFSATFSGVVRVYGLRYGPPPSPIDSVPAPWASDDIGLTGATGGATGDGIAFNVDGAGSNIWGSSDTFHFVYCTFSGDAEIVARVTSLADTNTFAKAGVMMRANAAPGAAHVILDVRPTGDIEFMTRSNDGGQTSWLGGSVQGTPVWLRLKRIESTVTASISGDGEAWRDVGSASLENATLAGLAVTSANASTLNRATFDNVAIE